MSEDLKLTDERDHIAKLLAHSVGATMGDTMEIGWAHLRARGDHSQYLTMADVVVKLFDTRPIPLSQARGGEGPDNGLNAPPSVGRVEVGPGDPLYGVWEAIGRDARLKDARQKLSAHEIVLLVGHARATAPGLAPPAPDEEGVREQVARKLARMTYLGHPHCEHLVDIGWDEFTEEADEIIALIRKVGGGNTGQVTTDERPESTCADLKKAGHKAPLSDGKDG